MCRGTDSPHRMRQDECKDHPEAALRAKRERVSSAAGQMSLRSPTSSPPKALPSVELYKVR